MRKREAEEVLETLELYRAKILDIEEDASTVGARTSTVSVRVRLSERRTLTAFASALGVSLGELLRPRIAYLLGEARQLAEFAATVEETLSEEGGEE